MDSVSTPAASKVGSEFQVNETTAGDQMFARVAMDASGNFTVVWQSQNQDSDGWDIYARRFDSSGNPVGSEFRVNTTTAGDQQNANIGMNASGEFRRVLDERRPGRRQAKASSPSNTMPTVPSIRR